MDISHLTQADRHPRWSTESLIHGAYREILCPEGSRASNSNWERVIMLVPNKHQNDFNIFTVSYSSLDQGPRVKHPLLNRRQLSLPPPRSRCLFFVFVSSLILNAFRSTTTHPESLKLICSSFPENDLGESSRPSACRSSSPCENDLNSEILAVSNRLFDRS